MTSSLLALTFDCGDAAALATFWSRVLGREVDADASGGFASIGMSSASASNPAWFFIAVPEGKAGKNRFHPDLVATGFDEEVARVVGLGATKVADIEEGGHHWVTLADPEGNEFDIVAG